MGIALYPPERAPETPPRARPASAVAPVAILEGEHGVERFIARRLLRTLSWVCLICAVPDLLMSTILAPGQWTRLITTAACIAAGTAGLILVRRERLALAAGFVVWLLWSGMMGACVCNGGLDAPAFMTVVPLAVVTAILLGWRHAVVLVAASGVAAAALLLAAGMLPAATPAPLALRGLATVMLAAGSLAVVADTSRLLRQGLDAVRDEAVRRQAAEAEAREQGGRNRALFDQLTQFTGLLTPDGRVVVANQSALVIAGLAEAAVVGQGFADTPWWAHDLAQRTRLQVAIFEAARGATVRFPATHRDDTGAVIEVDFSLKPFRDAEGSVRYIIFEGREVTRERQAEAAVRALNAQLEQRVEERTAELRAAKLSADAANRAKSLFLAGMTHEIRSPMTAILGFAQLLGREAGLSDQQRRHVMTIQRSGDHLLALLDEILDLSRIESGHLALSPGDFDPGQLVTVVAELAQAQARAKNLLITTSIAADLPREVRGDAGKLRQVLINLVTNAVKFTAAGVVAVEVRRDDGSRSDARGNAGTRLAFAVTDTGPGLVPADAEALFTHFGQGSAGRRAGGTGLGLAISQGHVRLMGGTLVVESEPGRGTTVRFSLPFSPAYMQPVALIAPAARCGRILVIDDQEENRVLLAEFLGGAGHTVQCANDGAAGLRLIRAWHPELVLLDMQMPGIDGMGVLKELPRSGDAPRPRVVALTANAFAEERAAILAAGADGFLGKPYRLAVLAELVGKQLAELPTAMRMRPISEHSQAVTGSGPVQTQAQGGDEHGYVI